MPPKTNQQRIKDLEELYKNYEESLDEMKKRIEELGEPDEGGMSLDERFENHRSIIIEVKDRLNDHVQEPDAHNAPFLARKSRSELKRIRAIEKAAREAQDED